MITTIIIGVIAVITIAIFTATISEMRDQISELKIDQSRLEMLVAELIKDTDNTQQRFK